MQFNPITKDVFTDKGQFVKRIECPLKMTWNFLAPIQGDLQNRHCLQCQNTVMDTENIADSTLLSIISFEPRTCIKISLLQANVTLTTKVNYENQK